LTFLDSTVVSPVRLTAVATSAFVPFASLIAPKSTVSPGRHGFDFSSLPLRLSVIVAVEAPARTFTFTGLVRVPFPTPTHFGAAGIPHA